MLFQQTVPTCKYCRNESSVVLYNKLALEALTAAAAKTPSTPLRVNDIWQDMTNFCGINYKRCKLQLSGGVHCTQAGREYTGLSVAFSILNALFDFGSAKHPPLSTPALWPSGSTPLALRSDGIVGDQGGCGAPPIPLNDSAKTGIPNVLLIGDSISMGFGYLRGDNPRCACGAGSRFFCPLWCAREP